MIVSQSFSSIQLPPTAIGPESIAFESGTLRFYTGVSDGRILQYNGRRDGFRTFGFTSPTRSKAVCDGTTDPELGPICGRPLGLKFHYRLNRLYVCDAYFGLMVLGSPGGLATPVANSADGEPIRFCNGLDVHQPSGNVYFTDTSAVYTPRNFSKALSTNDSTGRLLRYEPDSKRVTVLLKNLPGPVGAAVSQDQTYVLVSNAISNTTLKYWLQGPRANTYDIFQIQVRPNNIQRTVVGDFWQAAAMVREPAQSQTLVPIGQRINGVGMVARTINLEQWYGNASISEVQEARGALFIASRLVKFIGVYRI
ncbi:Six-bladed beta-propeller, TolB-like protein [Corchorus olitorius]|uniref:Six-bladed beta-propeller, TolB-like protein n=1 Tax=Corchorus olitorius TaxID=93759 RepID=A0A1R3KF60_9ROSI|nr:Six-bladed beta-propeller, TolB-like protein [Corchorus olitorius]